MHLCILRQPMHLFHWNHSYQNWAVLVGNRLLQLRCLPIYCHTLSPRLHICTPRHSPQRHRILPPISLLHGRKEWEKLWEGHTVKLMYYTQRGHNWYHVLTTGLGWRVDPQVKNNCMTLSLIQATILNPYRKNSSVTNTFITQPSSICNKISTALIMVDLPIPVRCDLFILHVLYSHFPLGCGGYICMTYDLEEGGDYNRQCVTLTWCQHGVNLGGDE